MSAQRERSYDAREKGKSRSTIIFMVFTAGYWDCSKRNLNASKPSEYPTKQSVYRWEHRLPGQDLFRHLIGTFNMPTSYH